MLRFLRHIILFLWVMPGITWAQDVEETVSNLKQRLQEDPLRLKGILGVYANHYATSLDVNRAAPFAGRLLAALNIDLLGIQAPFSLALSTGGRAFNYTLPAYSFVGISPSYKWVKVHLGDRSLDLGKYTFSRQSFKGVGTELRPGKLRFKAFYGRLRRARAEDFAGIQRIEPFYRRMGWGIQGGFQENQDKVLVAVFQGWDDPTGVVVPDSSFQFFPGKNTIISTEIAKQISTKLSLKVDYAYSGYTENVQSPTVLEIGFLNRFGGLLPINASTRWGGAFSTEVMLKTAFGSLSAEWERIDPGYKTMGSIFFQNDLQNVSLGAKIRLLEKKMLLITKLGRQQNNLSNNQANSFNRLISLLRLTYQISPRLQMDMGYSTFNHVNRRVFISDPLNPVPTSELALTNRDAQFSLNWIIDQSQDRMTNLQTTLQLNDGISILNDEVQDDGATQSLNCLIYLTRQYLIRKLNFGLSLSYQKNAFGLSDLTTTSVGMAVGKQWLDDRLSVQTHLSFGNSNQAFEGQPNVKALLFTTNLTLSYRVNDHNSFNLNSLFIRNGSANSGTQFSELRNSLVYQYRF